MFLSVNVRWDERYGYQLNELSCCKVSTVRLVLEELINAITTPLNTAIIELVHRLPIS